MQLLVRSCQTAILLKPFSSSFFPAAIKPSRSLSFSFSFSYFLFSTRPQIPKMSSKPSAFDALMSGARAAAKKKPQSSTSIPSPKKQRKSPDKFPPRQNPNPNSKPALNPCPVQNQSDSAIEAVENQKLNEVIDSNSSPLEVKKPKNPNASGARVVELKKKIASLKKKPLEFDPKTVACWEDNEKVPFVFLCLAFDMISNETGRIVITDIVCNALRTVMATRSDDLLAVVYLLANRIAPAHEGLELGIGDASIIKALAEACGRTEGNIREQYKKKGDLGLVAKESRSSQSMMRKPDPLTVGKVFDTFRIIAKESGQNSQEKKKNHIKALLVAATDCEPQYLIRLLQTKLRIGLAEQTLLAALGQAAVYAEKHSKPPPDIQSPLEEAARIVKKVYSVLPVYENIVAALLSEGVWNLTETCNFTLGVPVGPMLAKPTKGVSEIISKFQNMVYTCEYKYDGERAQIHYMENGSVEIYSRNAERNTGKFPDVVAEISRIKKKNVSSFVLDCELVAYDREKQKILSFQILSTRARKNVDLNDIKVDVCIYAFDMLYVNGQPLLQEQLKVRREHLYESFEEEPGFFRFATAITSNDVEEIQTFLEAAVNARWLWIVLIFGGRVVNIFRHNVIGKGNDPLSGLIMNIHLVYCTMIKMWNSPSKDSCEGLIIKTLDQDATYEPSKRSNNWLKLKKDYMDSIGDSVDLVPIAAFHGRGKRTGVYGAFLLACYDNNNEEFQSICKIGTGFSEAMLEERSASLRSKVIPKPKSYYRFSDTLSPDVWFEPTEVWEVKAADLTISPVHRAAVGIVDPDKGISLRFPRLLRVREDKMPEQGTSAEMIAEMYSAQKNNHPNNNKEDEDD